MLTKLVLIFVLPILQVVLLGLSIILPLMSIELLKFPKLCHLYFTLLRCVCQRGRGILTGVT